MRQVMEYIAFSLYLKNVTVQAELLPPAKLTDCYRWFFSHLIHPPHFFQSSNPKKNGFPLYLNASNWSR